MKRLGVFLLPPSSSQGYPEHFAGTNLYTWVERGTVRVKCIAQEHNTISPARTRTRTIRSGVKHSNHEVTAPPTPLLLTWKKKLATVQTFAKSPVNASLTYQKNNCIENSERTSIFILRLKRLLFIFLNCVN